MEGDDKAPTKNSHAGTNPSPARSETTSVPARGDEKKMLTIEANINNNHLEEEKEEDEVMLSHCEERLVKVNSPISPFLWDTGALHLPSWVVRTMHRPRPPKEEAKATINWHRRRVLDTVGFTAEPFPLSSGDTMPRL